MAKKEPKPEPKNAVKTPTEQPSEIEQPVSAKSDIRIFVALCR